MRQQQQQQLQPTPSFRQQGYNRGQNERPQLVLGQQPPLPSPNQLAVVNFAQTIEAPWEEMQALVPIMPYAHEGISSSFALVET